MHWIVHVLRSPLTAGKNFVFVNEKISDERWSHTNATGVAAEGEMHELIGTLLHHLEALQSCRMPELLYTFA